MHATRRFDPSVALTLAAISFATAASAQRLPEGLYDWETEANGVRVTGEYDFRRMGQFSMIVRGIDPPIKSSGRWELKGDNIVMYAIDGSAQTYGWAAKDLVLIANTSGMPTERVLLKKRPRSVPE